MMTIESQIDEFAQWYKEQLNRGIHEYTPIMLSKTFESARKILNTINRNALEAQRFYKNDVERIELVDMEIEQNVK